MHQKPSKITYEGDTELWWYGKEHFRINDNRISGYTNSDLLKVKMVPNVQRNINSLNLSSTEDDVLSLLGTPHAVTNGIHFNTWKYKKGYIRIKHDKIFGFFNSTPLKIKLQSQPRSTPTPNQIETQQTIFDVIDLIGITSMVIEMTHETWWYDKHFIIIKNAKVKYAGTINRYLEKVREFEIKQQRNNDLKLMKKRLNYKYKSLHHLDPLKRVVPKRKLSTSPTQGDAAEKSKKLYLDDGG